MTWLDFGDQRSKVTRTSYFANAVSQERPEGISSYLVQRSTWTQGWPMWQQSSPPPFDHLRPVFHYQHYQFPQLPLAYTIALQSYICYKQGACTTKQPSLPQTPATLSSRPHSTDCPPTTCCMDAHNHQAVVLVCIIFCYNNISHIHCQFDHFLRSSLNYLF